MASGTSQDLIIYGTRTRRSSGCIDVQSTVRPPTTTKLREKGYELNKTKALNKKQLACENTHIEYELKASKNFVISMSTSAYEFARLSIPELLTTPDMREIYSLTFEDSVDKNGSHVDQRIKVYNRRQDGTSGRQLKFTINFYHTTSRILVNGTYLNIFTKDIFENLCTKIRQNCKKLTMLNKSVASVIDGIKLPKSLGLMQIQHKPLKSDKCTPNEPAESDVDQCICPICNKVAGLDTIACDDCDGWFHFGCLGLQASEVNKIDMYNPYICDSCNENLLYEPLRRATDGQLVSDRDTTEVKTVQTISSRGSGISDTILSSQQSSETDTLIQSPSRQSFTTSSYGSTQQQPHYTTAESDSILDLNPTCKTTQSHISTTQPPPISRSGNVVTTIVIPPESVCPATSKVQVNSVVNGKSKDASILLSNVGHTPIVTDECRSGIAPTPPAAKARKTQTKNGTKSKLDESVAHRTYTIDLENKVRQMEFTIDLLQKSRNISSHPATTLPGDSPPTQQSENMPCKCSHELDHKLLTNRIQVLEHQLVQNMCITTSMHTQLALQLNRERACARSPMQWGMPPPPQYYPQPQINPYFQPFPQVPAYPPWQTQFPGYPVPNLQVPMYAPPAYGQPGMVHPALAHHHNIYNQPPPNFHRPASYSVANVNLHPPTTSRQTSPVHAMPCTRDTSTSIIPHVDSCIEQTSTRCTLVDTPTNTKVTPVDTPTTTKVTENQGQQVEEENPFIVGSPELDQSDGRITMEEAKQCEVGKWEVNSRQIEQQTIYDEQPIASPAPKSPKKDNVHFLWIPGLPQKPPDVEPLLTEAATTRISK